MFSKITLFAILAAATTAFAQCDTAPVQCCESTEQSDTPAASTLLGLLGVVIQGAAVPIGLTCTPVTVSLVTHLAIWVSDECVAQVIGVGGGTSCSQTPLCCDKVFCKYPCT